MRLACLLMAIMLLSACSETSNVANDATSAQRLLPNLAAYSATDVDTTIDGAFAALGGAAMMGGQIGVTAAVAKLEQILQCFQDRGAIAARFYQGDVSNLMAPRVGAAMVINQSRINQELINCALGGQESNASAQNVSIEPCAEAGSLTYMGDTISYVYVGSHSDVCEVFQLHFDNLVNSTSPTPTP
ncbi:MAG: hypothetical protein OXG92_00110 [Chloroflexi bacterium]|nr:hypothetical protein [Chloroflexota bacterium]MCY3582603.1 hypothetical protein [Chloroflexota bacterium]MCY3714858.1 hypothetical protein [Chloroflexota bacterium]MDE2651757.1 hypothetical protein [Chloroflexota bacterium]MXX84692.1 hypothetical protein [Chloroflexota bacterium]